MPKTVSTPDTLERVWVGKDVEIKINGTVLKGFASYKQTKKDFEHLKKACFCQNENCAKSGECLGPKK